MEAIAVAAITAVGAVLVALVQKGRKENSRDHAMVIKSLDRIEEKIDDHINDHATGKFTTRSRKSA